MAEPQRVVRALVCAEQPIVCEGLRSVVQRERRIVVVGEAADCRTAATAMRRLVPDIAILDIALPGHEGVQLLRLLRFAAARLVRTVVLATDGREEDAIDALLAGARGLLLWRAPPDELLDAVGAVAAGHALIAPQIAGRLLDRIPSMLPASPAPALAALGRLTRRERQVLDLIARGWATERIATSLGMRQVTVRSHVHHVLGKLGLRDRAEAVVFAYESGLVAPGSAWTANDWIPGDGIPGDGTAGHGRGEPRKDQRMTEGGPAPTSQRPARRSTGDEAPPWRSASVDPAAQL